MDISDATGSNGECHEPEYDHGCQARPGHEDVGAPAGNHRALLAAEDCAFFGAGLPAIASDRRRAPAHVPASLAARRRRRPIVRLRRATQIIALVLARHVAPDPPAIARIVLIVTFRPQACCQTAFAESVPSRSSCPPSRRQWQPQRQQHRMQKSRRSSRLRPPRSPRCRYA